ncbi:hypothetical protein HDV02_005203 [Globomyces sp. JEL0801]|nr:hypothetical protein HDV02_005203 [Globomyces sp. JEL0801]
MFGFWTSKSLMKEITQNFYRPETKPTKKVQSNKRTFTTFSIYQKQLDAIQHMQKHPSLRIFTFEFDIQLPGIRKFLVTTLEEFWNFYTNLPLDRKHYYELIPQGCACNLYFDIEFEILYNTSANGDNMIVLHFLQSSFLELCDVDVDVIELDSTTCTKFSRHLIFNFNHYAFINNQQIGFFVRNIVLQLESIVKSGCLDGSGLEMLDLNVQDISDLFVYNKDEQVIFIDLGVYTKNRNFRIVNSCKIHKSVSLKPIADELVVDFNYFVKSLVMRTDAIHLLEWIIPTIQSSHSITGSSKIEHRMQLNHTGISYPGGIDASQYQIFENHVLAYIYSKSSSIPKVKSQLYFPNTHTIVYNIIGSRYCHRVSREHKSNGVYYVVDILKKSFHQRCYDPDCFGFRSIEINIDGLILDSELFAEVTDEQLLDIQIDDLEELVDSSSVLLKNCLESSVEDSVALSQDSITDEIMLGIEMP